MLLSSLCFEPDQLFTDLPKPFGILLTSGGSCRGLLLAVTVVLATVFLDSLLQAAVEGGLRALQWSLDEALDERPAHLAVPGLSQVPGQFSGNDS